MSAGTAYERRANGEITKLPTRATVRIRTLGSPHYGVRIAVLLGAALAVAPTPVLAEIQVGGTPKAVRIEARDAPLEEILAALNRAFGVHYQVSVNLDKRLSGTYEGSLPQVLTGILSGYNLILYTDNGAMAVTVLGAANAPGTSPAQSPSSNQAVRQPSAAAQSAQAPVSSSGVKDVARKGPSSVLESVAEQPGAQAPAPPAQPRPSTAASQPRPSTAASQPRPSLAAPQPRPSKEALQPRPSKEAPQPRPSKEAFQPRPSTEAPQPRPSTAAPQPGQFTGLSP
jgi:hypothetical protein